MADEIVSAEEARGLVEASHDDGDFSEAAEVLLSTVIALHARVEAVEAERDEARRILAAARERLALGIAAARGEVADGQ
jgi:hypothetical protein